MGLEVMLVEWMDGPQGEAVQLLGRSADARIVELVRAHLRGRLGEDTAPSPAGAPDLRLIRNKPSSGSKPDPES